MKNLAKAILRPLVKPVMRGAILAFRNAVTPDGYVIRVAGRDTHPMDYLNLLQGRYEGAEVEILRNHFRPAAAIIEIGANIGYVARIAMEEKLQAGGRYIAVEPNPRAQAALEINLSRSLRRDPTKEFMIVAAAVDAPEYERDNATFIMRPNLSSGLPMHTATQKLGREDSAIVRATSLGALMAQYAPGGAALICDAEGAEIDMVLKDAGAFKNIDQMSIELHEKSITGREETPAQVLMALQKMGFSVGARVSNTYYLSR